MPGLAKSVNSRINFYEWCVSIAFGRRILDYLAIHVTLWDNSQPSSLPKRARARSIGEIADATGISQRHVRACLRRLRRKGLVQEDTPDHWHLALNV